MTIVIFEKKQRYLSIWSSVLFKGFLNDWIIDIITAYIIYRTEWMKKWLQTLKKGDSQLAKIFLNENKLKYENKACFANKSTGRKRHPPSNVIY